MKTNHRRKNKPPVDRRYAAADYQNGYPRSDGHERYPDGTIIERHEVNANGRVGRTGFLDKSMHGWGNVSLLSDRQIGAHIGNDFANGHRGMAKAVRGAKKFVRSRTRFHENAATQRIANDTSSLMD